MRAGTRPAPTKRKSTKRVTQGDRILIRGSRPSGGKKNVEQALLGVLGRLGPHFLETFLADQMATRGPRFASLDPVIVDEHGRTPEAVTEVALRGLQERAAGG